MDEELGLLSGSLTPRLQKDLTRLGTRLTFREAAEELAALLQVEVSISTARRLTESHGAAYVAVQTAEVEAIERQMPLPPKGPDKQLLSVDGAMVPLVGGEWAEVKTLALGVIDEPVEEKGELVVHARGLSYFSRLTDADTFSRLALVETHRRGVETADQVIAVNDGAVWIQGFIDYHRADAARVLDFPHAAEYISAMGAAVWGPDSIAGAEWFATQRHCLKHQGAGAVLPELRTLTTAHPELPELADKLAYLEKREAQMQYPDFQARGWPIASGAVESGNKLVVEARLKGAGMHWARQHVNPMLSLRNALASDRWSESWSQIAAHHHRQKQQQSQARRQQRLAEVSATVAEVKSPALLSSPMHSVPNAHPQPGRRYRPPLRHPWRRYPHPKAKRRSSSQTSCAKK